jgi:hypothetical protein
MFCGRDRTLSREHVFNRWMREHFAEFTESDHVRRLVTEGTDEAEEHIGAPLGVVVRRVCRECNHGWMQQMDNEVRPIIETMLDGEPRTLSILDQNTVAIWATKITLVLQAANMGRQAIVGRDHYRWFEQHRQPLLGSHIWLCHYTDKERSPFVSHQWGMSIAPEGSPPPQPGDPLNGLGVAFALGELGFWLFGVDLPGGHRLQSASDELRLLIWPSLSEVRWPPPRPVISDSELGELSHRLPTGTVRRGLRLD